LQTDKQATLRTDIELTQHAGTIAAAFTSITTITTSAHPAAVQAISSAEQKPRIFAAHNTFQPSMSCPEPGDTLVGAALKVLQVGKHPTTAAEAAAGCCMKSGWSLHLRVSTTDLWKAFVMVLLHVNC
jgi:hypothetical protein